MSATTTLLALLLALPIGAAFGSPPTSEQALTVEGEAQDARAGAVVITDDGATWFVAGLESWPSGVRGQRVTVVGRPSQARTFPEATVAPDGSRTAGVAPGSAPDDLLLDATWAFSALGCPPAPWRLQIADGSGNVTALWQDRPDGPVQWSRDPVQPHQSSSGIYSGGEPAAGEWPQTDADALWERLRALEADPASQADAREKGTVAVTLLSVAGQRELLVAHGAQAEGLVATLPR